MKEIALAVAEFFDILPEQLYAKNRKADVAQARFICYYFARIRLGIPFWAIANEFNVSSHASIMNGVNRINAQLDTYEDVRLQIKYLETILKDELQKGEIINLSQIKYKQTVKDLILNHSSAFLDLGINKITRLWMYKDLNISKEISNTIEYEAEIRQGN